MRVLELGSYIIPAYAGMLLAEQGADVVKWHTGNDPILSLKHGQELWAWINEGKDITECHAKEIAHLHLYPDIVIDNFRPATLAKWNIEPDTLAEEMHCIWVSMRSEVGETSFDLLAQCRSWMEYAPWVPLYVGDTTGGLWLAFKALSLYAERKVGHFVLGQATCMQKLVEGELVVTPDRDGKAIPWDTDLYRFDAVTQEAQITYKGNLYREPVRDKAWKLMHLWHKDGRMRI